MLAAALHDIGALSLRERLMALEFDIKSPQKHSEAGYRLLKGFRPLSEAASLIRYHRVSWGQKDTEDVPSGSHILNLADRIEALITRGSEILDQRRRISDTIRKHSGRFLPDAVDAFTELSERVFLAGSFFPGAR